MEALIGPDTINTIPVETLNAYRDHGHPERTLDQDVHKAYHLLNKLASVGIDLDAITQQLEDEGVEKFVSAFERLMSSIREKQVAVNTVRSDGVDMLLRVVPGKGGENEIGVEFTDTRPGARGAVPD